MLNGNRAMAFGGYNMRMVHGLTGNLQMMVSKSINGNGSTENGMHLIQEDMQKMDGFQMLAIKAGFILTLTTA